MSQPGGPTQPTSVLYLPHDLPKYGKPPVVEVAISVQFDELSRFKPHQFGLFYNTVKDRYPKTAHHPPLASTVELFGAQRDKGGASLSFEGGLPVGRYWYLSDDEHRLVQLQPDRFILNWRKLDADTHYPSYQTLREEFRKELEAFLEFVDEHELGTVEPAQCEVTYVNHLPSGLGWQSPADLSNVIAPWSGRTSEPFPSVEDVRLSWQYRFEENDSPVGRLHVQANSATRRSDRAPIVVLQLVARGAPTQGDVNGVLDLTDKAHVWIVRGFTAVTTEPMHKLWERQQ